MCHSVCHGLFCCCISRLIFKCIEAAKDCVWIPKVAALGWLIVTRDRAIQGNRAEIDAVRELGANMINLASAGAASTRRQLKVFMTRWREIEALIDTPSYSDWICTLAGCT